MKLTVLAAFAFVVSSTLVAEDALPALTIDAQERTVVEVITSMANQARLNVVVMDSSLDNVLAQRVTLQTDKRPWVEVTDLLRARYQIAIHVEKSTLTVVSSRKEALRDYSLQVYDVRSLIHGVVTFPGVDLSAGVGPGSTAGLLQREYGDGAPMEIAELKEQILSQVVSGGWNEFSFIKEWNGMLAISQTKENHQKIESFLAQYEVLIGRQVIARVYRVPAPADASVIVKGDALTALVNQGTLYALVPCRNNCENSHFSGTQRRILADLDIVQNRMDPITSIVCDGLTVQIRPVITVGGILADMQLQYAPTLTSTKLPVTNVSGQLIAGIDQVQQHLAYTSDKRLVPLDQGTLYQLGDQCFLVTFSVEE